MHTELLFACHLAGMSCRYRRTREGGTTPIGSKHTVIRELINEGHRVAAHTYVKPGGLPKFMFAAKHRGTGRLLQGSGSD